MDTRQRIKPKQILDIVPHDELRFEGWFRDVVTVQLELINNSDKRVCFKVKSNAPQYYLVQPTGAVIESNNKSTVLIMLQTKDGNAPADAICHKFLVQSIVIQEDEPLNGIEKLWRKTKADEIMETKIPCVFISKLATNVSSKITSNGLSDEEIKTTSSNDGYINETKSSSSDDRSISLTFFLLLIIAVATVIAYKFFL